MNAIQTTLQRALKINLDPEIYGTFAEIGAGQDVAGNFFKAGAASGTVAKSISAYDMTFSDEIYGREESGRYVCQSRVEKMVDYEYKLIIERLAHKNKDLKFFSYSNTVSARNFHGTNEPHGWMAIRFQHEKDAESSDLIVHVRLHDQTNLLQQKSIGIFGVNMIHTAYFARGSESEIVADLMCNLDRANIEIDMIKVSGPAFANIDSRLLNLQLIVNSITDAVMFNEDGEVCLAKDELYKKNIILSRGSYRPPTKVNTDILYTGVKNFIEDKKLNSQDVVSVAEITINHLKEDGELTQEDFLARVDLLASIGQRVIISNMPQFFSLTSYISSFKPKNIALTLGVYNFMQIFDDEYTQLSGGIIEALGKLFKSNLTVYLYPYREDSKEDTLIDLDSVNAPENCSHLFEHIKKHGQVKNLVGYNDNLLHIYSRKVLTMIRNNEVGWEEYVPSEISKTINEKCLFGHPCTNIIKS